MITLDRYNSKGPFKTDIIMRTELSRANAKWAIKHCSNTTVYFTS
jgi:hypothetical protein